MLFSPGRENVIYVEETPVVQLNPGPSQLIVSKFDFKTRKTDTIVGGVTSFVLAKPGEGPV